MKVNIIWIFCSLLLKFFCLTDLTLVFLLHGNAAEFLKRVFEVW